MIGFPSVAYRDYATEALRDVERIFEEYDLPYIPSVSVGWDSTPRTDQMVSFTSQGYPFEAVLVDNTPEEFEAVLKAMREILSQRVNEKKIFTINAWNEWTEGSYLEPDSSYGMGYLEAIKRVFG